MSRKRSSRQRDHETLGEFFDEYRWSRGRVFKKMALGVALILLGAIVAGWMFNKRINHPNSYINASREVGFYVMALGFPLPLASLGGWAAFTAFGRIGQKLLLFAHGFVLQTRRRTETLSWEEIAAVSVYSKKMLGRPDKTADTFLTLTDREGKKLVLTDFEDMMDLVREISEETLGVMLPRLRQQLERGKVIDFGGISVTKAGIERKEDFAPWAKVTRIWVQGGSIFVDKKGRSSGDRNPYWLSQLVAKTPNFHLLLAISLELMNSVKNPKPRRLPPSDSLPLAE
jgi:hypothetical protein